MLLLSLSNNTSLDFLAQSSSLLDGKINLVDFISAQKFLSQLEDSHAAQVLIRFLLKNPLFRSGIAILASLAGLWFTDSSGLSGVTQYPAQATGTYRGPPSNNKSADAPASPMPAESSYLQDAKRNPLTKSDTRLPV